MHWLCLWKQTLVSYWLLFIFPGFIDSSRTLFAGDATLDYHLLSSVLWCYQQLMLFFNFGGDLPLMDFNLWWSFPSGGAILHTASAYTVVEVFLLLLLLCSPCPLWWSVGYWHRPVHTATQLNRLSTDLLATDSRVRSPLTTILVCLLLLLSSEKKKLWLSLLIGFRHKRACALACVSTKKYVLVVL